MENIINFIAFCLPVFLFSYWGVIGYATLSLLQSKRNTLQNILLAPAIGLAVTLLPILWLNQAGLPINSFATILCIVLFAISICIIWWRKPLFPIRHYLPFACIFFLALCLTGRPLLKFGFDWVSFANTDATYYSLGATRLLHHAFFDVPNINDLLSGQDYSLLYWFSHVPSMARVGSEMILGWMSAITHLNPLQIYMPVILGFHLILISAVGALVYVFRYNHYVALISCLLMSFSALTTLGTLYQLIGQVSGLCLLIAAIILTLHKFSSHKKQYAFCQGILIALVISALLIMYPEISPFFGISFIAYFIINYFKGWRPNKSFLHSFLYATIFIIIFLNINLIYALYCLLMQVAHGTSTFAMNVFPYYLLPSGLANLWGIQPLANYQIEPFASIMIFVGIVLTIIALIATLRLLLRHTSPPATVTFIMTCVALNLFKKNAGFGLFKLAMFIQPFLLSVIVITIFTLIKKNRVKIWLVLGFILINFINLNYYVQRSEAKTPGPFSEIAFGSNTKLNQEYSKIIKKTSEDDILISNDFNLSIIQMQALQSVNHNFKSLHQQFFILGNEPFREKHLDKLLGKFLINKISDRDMGTLLLSQYLETRFPLRQFSLFDTNFSTMDFYESYCLSSRNCMNQAAFIVDTGLRSTINRRVSSEITNHNFDLRKIDELKNHLVFTSSSLGDIFFPSFLSKNITLFNLELDPTFPNSSMQAIGEYLLFGVIQPVLNSRISISVTNTFDGDGKNKLPIADVIGDKRIKLPFCGRGSARVFSDPISFQVINNVSYLAVDMNKPRTVTQKSKTGLMNLYNRDIDIYGIKRMTTTFTRDISLVAEDEYQKLNAPNLIKTFPTDLANQNLEYSGIYEDGWISEDSFFVLNQLHPTNHLRIKGMLPSMDADQTGSMLTVLTILIDNKKFKEEKIMPGDFIIDLPNVSTSTGRKKIELHFSKWQHLPRGDNRIVAALIKSIGFE